MNIRDLTEIILANYMDGQHLNILDKVDLSQIRPTDFGNVVHEGIREAILAAIAGKPVKSDDWLNRLRQEQSDRAKAVIKNNPRVSVGHIATTT